MKALKEETVKTIAMDNPFTPKDMKWLDIVMTDGTTIGVALKTGLDIVTKEDSGTIFDTWNKYIVDVVGLVPELKEYITTRKTKKGKQYYGVNIELWNALKSGTTEAAGLPAL